MHSHHSHSGDYVSHASDTLETVTKRAIDMKFDTFCLTEHQPRLSNSYLYPEELDKQYTVTNLQENFDNYYKHAKQIQQRSLDRGLKTKFLVGFEVEGLDEEHIDRSVEFFTKVQEKGKYHFDMCVGSVHFVRGIPIDFDEELWNKARDACGSVYELFEEYFDLQYLMLTKVKPTVVGHFDLILLKCGDSVVDDKVTGKKVKSELNVEKDWPKIWVKIIRNIKFVKSYGGLFELNSASLRKGWSTPYPSRAYAEAIRGHGDALFCLSDDSHAITQIGLNFHKVLEYADKVLHLEKLYYVDLDDELQPVIKSESMEEIKVNDFWKQYQ